LKKFVWFTLVLCLTGCKPTSTGTYSTADGYSFERKEFTRTVVDLRIVIHPSQADLSSSINVTDGSNAPVMAYSIISPTGNTCTVHIVDPAVKYTPEWIGHEITHCIFGRFHSQPGTSIK
jgi:hypothetical protein